MSSFVNPLYSAQSFEPSSRSDLEDAYRLFDKYEGLYGETEVPTVEKIDRVVSGEWQAKPAAFTFKCPIDTCDKSYRYKSDLKNHVVMKHATLPHIEDILNRMMPQRVTKLGRSFPCPYPSCPSGYKREKDLRRHIKMKHPEKVILFSCPYLSCPSGFITKQSLQRHLRVKHSDRTAEKVKA